MPNGSSNIKYSQEYFFEANAGVFFLLNTRYGGNIFHQFLLYFYP